MQAFIKNVLKNENQLDLYYYILFQKLYHDKSEEEITTIDSMNEYLYYINKYCNNNLLLINLEKMFSKQSESKKIFKRLALSDNIKLLKKDALTLVGYAIQEYNMLLKREIRKIKKSNFLFLISQHMSYVSILSSTIIADSYTDEGHINFFEMLLEYISKNKEKHLFQALALTGLEKKRCEYLMQIALDEDNFHFKEDGSVDLENQVLIQIFHIVDELIYWNSVEMILKSNRTSKLDIYFDGIKLIFGDDFDNKMNMFGKSIKDGGHVELDDDDAQRIYKEFKKITGYNADDIEKLVEVISNRKGYKITLTEKQFIAEITEILGISVSQSKQLLESLTLQKSKNNRISNDLFDIDNKLSARPIILIGDYYVTDILLLHSAIPYFKQRILTKKIHGADKISDVLFRNRHEAELSIFQKKIDIQYKNGINFDLMKVKEFQKKLQNVKNITKEVDFYFIKEETMYLIEYKDFSPELNVVFMNKIQSKLEKEFFKKHMNLRTFLNDNKEGLSTLLTSEIKYFKSFFVFKNRTALSSFLYHEDIVLYNKDDFIELLKTM